MKRAVLCIIIVALLALYGCSGNNTGTEFSQEEKPSEESVQTKSAISLREKADAVLDELLPDHRVDDFREAVNILSLLPSDGKKFLKQEKQFREIYEDNDIEMSDQIEAIFERQSFPDEEYKTRYYEHELWSLIESLVYPAIFDKYGDDAEHLPHLMYADAVASAWEDSFTGLKEQKHFYDHEKDVYVDADGVRDGDYVINYYSNGLVESVGFVIAYHSDPYSDDDFKRFFELSLDEQKKVSEDRFEAMARSMTRFANGYGILDKLYSPEEQAVLLSYINSLTGEQIWANDMMTMADMENSSYAVATLSLRYGETKPTLDFSLNRIKLRLYGTNVVNDVTSRYYTVLCAFLEDTSYQEMHNYESCKAYIERDTSSNTQLFDWQISLDAIADNYSTPTAEDSATQSEPAEHDAETVEINPGSYYSLRLPADWEAEHKYEMYVTETTGYGYNVSFFSHSDRERGYGGFLFSLDLIPEGEAYEFYPSYDYICSVEVYRINGFDLIAIYPTDVQFGEDSIKEYQSMRNKIPSIIQSIQFNDEVTIINSAAKFGLK